jgi:hypothetical protein
MEDAITGAPPLNFVHPHAKLRNSQAICATTSVHRNRHSALCQRLKFARSILRDDIRSITQICPPDTPLHGTVLLADDSLFRDHRWSTAVRSTPEPLVAVPTYLPNILVHLSQLHKKGTLTFLRERLLHPIRPSLMGQSQMVQNLRPQSQRKHPRPRRHPTRFP